MRLWSIHPKYLDAKGLVALWREALLAQKVLLGQTKGYVHHPQLTRFRSLKNPLDGIICYLNGVADEADRRGYQFNRHKIGQQKEEIAEMPVTKGQVAYEFSHLLHKLKVREPVRYEEFKMIEDVAVHPVFTVIHGDVEKWEKTNQ